MDRVARRVVRGSTPATAPRARSRSRTPEADIPTPASPSSEPQRRHGRRPRAPLQAETTPQHDRSLARAHARGQPRQAERRRRGTEGEVARAVPRARREGFRALDEELDPRVRVRLPDAPPGRALSPTPRRRRVVRLGKRQRRSLGSEIRPRGVLRGWRRRDGFAARIALERRRGRRRGVRASPPGGGERAIRGGARGIPTQSRGVAPSARSHDGRRGD